MFVDKSNIGHVNFNVYIPPNLMEKKEFIYEKLNEILKKLVGEKITHGKVLYIKDLLLDTFNNEDFIGLEIKSDDFCVKEIWDLDDIIKYSNEPKYKDKYTNIEVNNLLFDLHIKGKIGGYSCVALPCECSFNLREFNGTVFVIKPIIDILIDPYDMGKEAIESFCNLEHLDMYVDKEIIDTSETPYIHF